MDVQNLIRPDRGFVDDIVGLGGDSVKKCFQCATCSVICPHASDDDPFPRREMAWTQWGLKDRLLKDANIWLCHQCNDCSVNCPREAAPGNVLAALRNYSFGYYGVPSLLGRAFRLARYQPLLLAFPVVLFLILLAATGNLEFPEGQIVFEHFIPHVIVDPVFLVLVGVVLVSLSISLRRFWKGITSNPSPGEVSMVDALKSSAVPKLAEFLLHRRFNDCGTGKAKTISHMALVYGFLAFALVTGSIFLATYTVGIDLPLASYHPLKIIANLGAVAVVSGCCLVIFRRLKGGKEVGNSSYLDWNLILLILTVTSLGILTEVLRLAEAASAAYIVYFIHLVFVFYLIAYLPFSKLAHPMYRLLAILYADYRDRSGMAGEATG